MAEGPRRRPVSGGYARGDEKRLQIIAAALRVFGDEGYEKASTRQIAFEAGVNPPALQYYFDGKQGLHRACAEHIVQSHIDAMEPAYLASESIQQGDPPPRAIAALCVILEALADHLFGSVKASHSKFIARLHTDDSAPHYVAMKQKLSARLFDHCGHLVSVAVGLPADDPRLKLQTWSILGQLTVFHISRDNALAWLNWPDFEGDRLALMKAQILRQTQAILKDARASGAPAQ